MSSNLIFTSFLSTFKNIKDSLASSSFPSSESETTFLVILLTVFKNLLKGIGFTR
jgi:hypothetical protein